MLKKTPTVHNAKESNNVAEKAQLPTTHNIQHIHMFLITFNRDCCNNERNTRKIMKITTFHSDRSSFEN